MQSHPKQNKKLLVFGISSPRFRTIHKIINNSSKILTIERGNNTKTKRRKKKREISKIHNADNSPGDYGYAAQRNGFGTDGSHMKSPQ